MSDWTEKPETIEQVLDNLTAENWHSERALIEAEIEKLRGVIACVLQWPLPQGTVETYALPPWLARNAREALGSAVVEEIGWSDAIYEYPTRAAAMRANFEAVQAMSEMQRRYEIGGSIESIGSIDVLDDTDS